MTTQQSTLEIDCVAVDFDGIKAVDEVTMTVRRGEVLGLIGPNGSGKTTTLNVLSGLLRPTAGHVRLDGRDVTKLEMRRRVGLGVARTFQSGRVFGRLTVAENIEVAALGSGRSRKEARSIAAETIDEVHLSAVADVHAENLTAGLIRTTAFARALAVRPNFLLLDEPAAGQNESEAADLIETIRSLARHRRIGILLVEHDMAVVMGACDRLHVLDSGRTVIEGDPAKVRHDPQVIEIYFGKQA